LTGRPGVRTLIPRHDVTGACADLSGMPDDFDGEQCGGFVFVGTCAQLAQVMTMSGCDDSRPARIDPDTTAVDSPSWSIDKFHGEAVDLAIHEGDEVTTRTIDLTGDPISMDVWATVGEWIWPSNAEGFIHGTLTGGGRGPVTDVRGDGAGR